MLVKRNPIVAAGLAISATLLGTTTPARADVKAGADSWSKGDYTLAVREWTAPAEAGDPDAQFNLGQAYRLGRGVPRDLARAEALFAKAAAQGHVQAADNYGLLMFDRGERAAAMPYVRAAAERGDPRAQYLMGIAHFNGDLAPKDWTRAYAYMTLAQSAGLPQAGSALKQMDQHIPIAQRQTAAGLAAQLGEDAQSRRATQLAAADLSGSAPGVPVTAQPASAPPSAPRPAAVPSAPVTASPTTAVAAATRIAGADTPATAGADFARPAARTAPAPKPVAAPAPASAKPKPAAPRPSAPAASGVWRVQLGAFGVAANADALWARARARPELAGHARIDVPAGKVKKLQAGGFASREAAAMACAALAGAGFSCLPAQD